MVVYPYGRIPLARIPLWSYTPVSVIPDNQHPYTLIPAYPYSRIPSYPYTRITPYPETCIPLCFILCDLPSSPRSRSNESTACAAFRAFLSPVYPYGRIPLYPRILSPVYPIKRIYGMCPVLSPTSIYPLYPYTHGYPYPQYTVGLDKEYLRYAPRASPFRLGVLQVPLVSMRCRSK